MVGGPSGQAVWNDFKLTRLSQLLSRSVDSAGSNDARATAESAAFGRDMNQHIDRRDVVPVGRIRKVGKQHPVSRNIDQTVGVRIIEMMMVRCVGIKDTVLVMDRNPPQQAGIGKLVQRILDGAAGHLHAGIADFAGKTIGGNMARTSVEQQSGNGQPLFRRTESGVP